MYQIAWPACYSESGDGIDLCNISFGACFNITAHQAFEKASIPEMIEEKARAITDNIRQSSLLDHPELRIFLRSYSTETSPRLRLQIDSLLVHPKPLTSNNLAKALKQKIETIEKTSYTGDPLEPWLVEGKPTLRIHASSQIDALHRYAIFEAPRLLRQDWNEYPAVINISEKEKADKKFRALLGHSDQPAP